MAAKQKKIRYAVVGLGYFAQIAALPAFKHARANSELAALVSGDPAKLKKLGRRYGVKRLYSYEDYGECLQSGMVDAVYIALPNSLHREYAVRALKAGIHVLCEKPLAVTEAECREMIGAARSGGAKLMTAYRLHFDEANLKAVRIARSGRLGEIRAFNSFFSMQVKAGNIRLKRDLGGGTLYDIGIYCINAARYLFRSEPYEVVAFSANKGEARFAEVDEMTSAILRFPGERLASFTASFGAADHSSYRLVGTKGDLFVSPAYNFAVPITHELTLNGKTKKKTYPKRDQFGPELVYFSNCILKDLQPEPSGTEGLIDVQIIRALYQSGKTGRPVTLQPPRKAAHPDLGQEIHHPPFKQPTLYNANNPSY